MKEIKLLKGTPASPGRVRAKAFIIDDPLRLPSIPNYDYIVVAQFTTPVLNLLLSGAKGIVCQGGGITMHAAIIARELGIPCVVGAEGVLAAVKKGEEVEVDGELGEVKIYE